MDNFWDLSDGEDAFATGNTFESGGGKMELIPDNTTAVALIDEAKWETDRDNNDYISLRWSILTPSEYKNRKIWQKLWVKDLNPNTLTRKGEAEAIKKRDKDKKMLAAIDANAGGRLAKARKQPTDEALGMGLTNKPMQIKIMAYAISGNTGNYIAAVSPRGGAARHVEDDDAPF